MIRTLFWEQSDNWEKVLKILQEQNICDIRIWVGKNCKCTHDVHSFDYATLARPKYHGLGKDIYDHIYKYLCVFIDMYSRNYSPSEQNRYNEKTIHDVLNIFNILFDYFTNLLLANRIDLVVLSRMPHLGADYLMCRIAEALGIRVLIFYQSLFPNKFFYVFNLDDFGEFRNLPTLSPPKPFHIPKQYEKDLFYMDKTVAQLNPHILKIQNFFDHKFSLDDKYIYFPLHLQPEMTTSNLGGIYNDQILAIEQISNLIPEDWFVYVKENPKQTAFMRGEWFYKRLRAIKNIKMVPIETSTYSLTSHSQFVATITGTAGWEAISGGTNVLVFGNPWYKTLPGVFCVDEKFSINKILNYEISHVELENKLGFLLSKAGDGVTYKGYEKIVPDFNADQNAAILSESIKKILHFAFNANQGNKTNTDVGESEKNKTVILLADSRNNIPKIKAKYETDWLASDPVFYNEVTGAVSTNINNVIDFNNLEFHPEGFNNYLDFGYSVFEQTPIKNVKFLRYSSRILQYNDGTLGIEYLEDPVVQCLETQSHEDDVLELLSNKINEWEKSVQGDIVIPTSGGYDSRLLSLLIKDKSRIRSFTYGLSDDQQKSFEVVHAKLLSEAIGSNWTWIPLGNYHTFFDQWDQIYGISTHAHGMYHMEFYNKILEIKGFTAPFLSGIIGDGWSGGVSIPVIESDDKLIHLGYSHGMKADSQYSLLKSKNMLRERYFHSNQSLLQNPSYRIVEAMRMKIILLSYLMKLPRYFGFNPWSPFLISEIALGMLNLPLERRKDRLWQKEFFKKQGLNFEEMSLNLDHKNTLNLQAIRNVPPQPLNIDILREVINDDYIQWINNQLSEYIKKGIYPENIWQNDVLKAYFAYLTLRPVEACLLKRNKANG